MVFSCKGMGYNHLTSLQIYASLGIAGVMPHMVVSKRTGDNLQGQDKCAETNAGY